MDVDESDAAGGGGSGWGGRAGKGHQHHHHHHHRPSDAGTAASAEGVELLQVPRNAAEPVYVDMYIKQTRCRAWIFYQCFFGFLPGVKVRICAYLAVLVFKWVCFCLPLLYF